MNEQSNECTIKYVDNKIVRGYFIKQFDQRSLSLNGLKATISL
jgi:hypothetical protein